MTPRLMREGRVTGAASALFDDQLVLLAMIGPIAWITIFRPMRACSFSRPSRWLDSR